ncbi:MAG: hypothetical protein KDK99_06710, partial [Verrucomicrobiales bacterium]|nr:hypothetical protein [Verrucomicrobiales bacterium]
GLPDVRAVKASVDAHRRAQERLQKMHDQLERLQGISKHHEAWRETTRESVLYAHLAEAIRHEEALESLTKRRNTLDERRAEHADNQEAYDRALREREELRHVVEAARAALGDRGLRLEENQNRRQQLTTEIDRLQAAANSVHDLLRERVRRWQDWTFHAARLGLQVPETASTGLSQMKSGDDLRALDAARNMSVIYNTLREQAMEALQPLEARLRDAEARKSNLQKDISQIREGQAAPAPLLNAIRARGQRAAALGRVVEVKPEAESWWPLLETVIGDYRRAILPEDFRAAWDQAQKTPSSTEPLLQSEEIPESQPRKGSLREMVETSHPDAARFLDHLLGDIMPVKKASQLEKHARALSADGWLKDPPRRVKLTPERELSLGEEGLRRLRELRENELRDTQAVLEEVQEDCNDLRAFLNRGREWGLDHFTPPEGSAEITRLPRLRADLAEQQATWDLIATPDAVKQVENLKTQEATLDGVKERLIRLDERMAVFKQFEREETDALARLEESEAQTRLTRETSRARLTGVTDADISQRLNAAQQQTKSWRRAAEIASAMAGQMENRAVENRRLRDEARRDLIASAHHPELADALDIQALDNDAFDQRRIELETHELDRYKDEAEKARLEWEDRLQHQVLDVLREKLSEADRTKRELNRAMDHEIGGWRYQLTSRADKAHTAIWTLVEKGLPSGEELELFNAAAREDIERAKVELMAAIDAADNPDDKRHQRALDYRYYHHWDIEAKPAGRADAAAISLNKSAKKQSGGENQAPFFVATLAAFRRVYDLGRREDARNLGLVVMDEAFSKLSGDRIDDCLALARGFGLQLIMAFPEDRLPTMFQHADTVVQCRVERGYDEQAGHITQIENWVVRVEGRRLAELVDA